MLLRRHSFLRFGQLNVVTAVCKSNDRSGAAFVAVKMPEVAGRLGRSEIFNSLFSSCPVALVIQKQPTLQMLDENFHNKG